MKIAVGLLVGIGLAMVGCSNEQIWLLSTADETAAKAFHRKSETSDQAPVLSFEGIKIVVRANNGIPMNGNPSMVETVPLAITFELSSAEPGLVLREVEGTITFSDGRKLQPNEKELLSSTCLPNWKTKTVLAAISDESVRIAVASPLSAQLPMSRAQSRPTCIRFGYKNFVDPHQSFILTFGKLSRDDYKDILVTMDFSPTTVRTSSH